MHRREWIAAIGTIGSISIAGCIDPIREIRDDHSPHPREYVDDWQEEVLPATGEAITVETDEIQDSKGVAGWYGADLLRAKLSERFPDANLNSSPMNGSIHIGRSWIEGIERPPGVAFDDLRDATPKQITVIVEGGDEYQFDVYVGDRVTVPE